MTFPGGFGQDSLNRPAVMQSAGDDTFAPSESIRPLLHIHGFTVECQQSVVAPVVGLLFGGCPSAVIRRVVAVVVDAIKPSARRRITHVGIESCERFAPSVADADATRTVANEGRVFFAVAAAQHAAPCAVFAWFCSFAQVVASRSSRSLALRACQAAAGLRSSALQVVRRSYLFTAAVARTFPQRLSSFRCFGITRNNQLSKPRTGQINVSHITGLRLCVPSITT